MKRLTFTTLAVLAFFGASNALGGVPANEYRGTVERDDSTYFGFDLKRSKARNITAFLPYTCTNGEGGRAAFTGNGSIGVENGKFSGRVRFEEPVPSRSLRGGENLRGSYLVTGELLSQGKAKGTIDAQLKFERSPARARGNGTETARCYSGGLDWKASKGAMTR